MRSWLTPLIFAATVFLIPHRADARLHVVFDLDWTLLYDVTDHPPRDLRKVIRVEGRLYRISDHTAEVIEALLRLPDVSISFFSGGAASRNLAALKQMHLSDGRSLAEIAYRILSSEDLTNLYPDGVGENLRFSERLRKDLVKVDPDLDDLVIFEDLEKFVLPGQERNVLFLGRTYEYFDSWSYVQAHRRAHPEEKYLPATEAEYWAERNKLVRGLDLVMEAREESGSVPFANRVQGKLADPVHPHIERGMERIRTSGVPSVEQCRYFTLPVN